MSFSELNKSDGVREDLDQTFMIAAFNVLDTAEKCTKTIDAVQNLGTLRPGKFVMLISNFIICLCVNIDQLDWIGSIL